MAELVASAIAGMAVRSLADLLVDKQSYFGEASVEAERLLTELTQMKAFLDESDIKQVGDKRVHDWLVEIQKVADDIADVVEIHALESRRKKGFAKIFKSSSDRKLAKDLETLKQKVKHLREVGELYGMKKKKKEFSQPEENFIVQSKREKPRLRRDDDNSFVGMQEEMKKLLHLALEDKGSPRIVIVGMGGIGKTSLARRIYKHEKIRSHFKAFAWIHVGQVFETASILRKILEQLLPETTGKKLNSYTKLEMCEKIYDAQQSVKCLVVLDDVWSEEFWDSLRIAFPPGKTGSKLLVTSRNMNLAHKMKTQEIHTLRPLTDRESWELFKRKAFLDTGQDNQKDEMIKNAVGLCGGLPLAVNVLGGLLASKNSVNEWEMVLNTMKSSLADHVPDIFQVLSLGYDDLSEPLKPCFLYLGLFPDDSPIDVERLYQLWIAEGFIQYESGGVEVTMMDVAEGYLDALATRCLVEVQEVEVPNIRQFKSCRLQNLLRDLCLRKGKEESLFKTVDLHYGNEAVLTSSPYSSIGRTRRFAMFVKEYDNKDDCSFQMETARYPRSFLVFNVNQYQRRVGWLPESVKSSSFKLLRVLSFDGFDFQGNRLPRELGKLVFLKYLGFRECHLEDLPPSIGDLWNLQTLDLHLCACKMAIPNVLWKLTKLRQLYLPPAYHACDDDKLRLDGLKDLETLENFDTAVCNAIDLLFLTNLRNLAVNTDGNFEDLESIIKCINVTSSYLRQSSLDVRNFYSYTQERLVAIRKLFESDGLHTLHIDGHIGTLPKVISSSLTEIIFSDSELVEDPMSTLEKFPNLWVLILRNQAFLGKQMVCSAFGFRQLRQLTLSNLDDLESLVIEQGAMPNLSALTIEGCKSLEKFPRLDSLTGPRELKFNKMHSIHEYRDLRAGDSLV